MYGLYLVLQGFEVVIIEPQEIGYTNREWNISLEELMQVTCILSKEEIINCILGKIVNEGNIQFLNLFEYKCKEVLDYIVDSNKFLKTLKNKIINNLGKNEEDIFFQTHYVNFKLKKDKICVFTSDGRKIEGKLFLHGMGSQDEINYYDNVNLDKTCFNVVGINGIVGYTNRPNGDILHSFKNDTYGPNKQQIFWELFQSEEPKSDCATIYAFTIENQRCNLVELMKYFEANLFNFIQTEVKNVHKALFGFIDVPDYVNKITRSHFPRVYAIGEININSKVTGSGFAMCIKNLDFFGKKLTKVLKNDNGTFQAMNAKKLNKIRPETRKLCTLTIEQVFEQILMRSQKKYENKINIYGANMLKFYSQIGNEKKRNEMLKSVISPQFIFAILTKIKDETKRKRSYLVDILQSNQEILFKGLWIISLNYFKLILYEIKEVSKHIYFSLLLRKGQLQKSYLHIENILLANPLKFIYILVLLGKMILQYKNGKQQLEDSKEELVITEVITASRTLRKRNLKKT